MLVFIRDLIITFVIIGTLTYLLFRKKQDFLKKLIAVSVLGTVIYMIFWITGVTPRYGFNSDINWERVEMVPLQGIKTVLYSGINEYAVMNILGNILMFFPIGYLFPFLFEKLRKWYRIIPLGMLISCLIEFTQLFLKRGTDIDDILLNVLGTLFGYVFYKLTKFFLPDRTKLFEEEAGVWNIYWIPIILIPYVVEFSVGFIDLLNRF